MQENFFLEKVTKPKKINIYVVQGGFPSKNELKEYFKMFNNNGYDWIVILIIIILLFGSNSYGCGCSNNCCNNNCGCGCNDGCGCN